VSGGNALAVTMSVTAGFAGAVQVAVMGRLGERVGVVEAVAFSGIVTVLFTLAVLLAARQSVQGIADALHQPAWLWLGGVMSAVIIFAITIAGPRIGILATSGILISGQFVAGTVIDRLGLLGQERVEVSWERVLGLVLLAAGAALALRR
jgi:bacterial/archaeal transporter family-2 protein